MKNAIWKLIQRDFERFPDGMAGRQSQAEVRKAFAGRHAMDPDYLEFVLRYGSGHVGSYPIYGLAKAKDLPVVRGADTIFDVTRHFVEEGWAGVGEWLIFTFDHCGNPVGFARNGSVWISDHDFGGPQVVAKGFEEFLEKRVLRRELDNADLGGLAMAAKYRFEARPWKEDIVCVCAEGKFVLDYFEGAKPGMIFFPTKDGWASSCPVWAREDWALVRELLIAWCEENKAQLVESDLHQVMRYRPG